MSTRRRPYVQNVRRTRATIRWTSLNPGFASVLIRNPSGVERTFDCYSIEFTPGQTGLPYTYFRHAALLTGLEPGTAYSYRVLLDGQVFDAQTELSFRTAGVPSFTFLALGDTGAGTREQEMLAQRMQLEPQAALVVHTGDLAYPSGFYEAYENRYFDYYHALMRRVPFYPCPGNHDYYETRANPYVSVHDLPADGVIPRDQGRYYSFDWGDTHFISLDTNEPLTEAASGRGDMLRWLEQDLAATKKFWRIVFFHHPPYAFGPNSAEVESARVRTHIVPILERYGVPFVLNGHEHSYQRTHPIHRCVYVTTGGGGAQLYEVHASDQLAFGQSRYHYLRIQVEDRKLTLRALSPEGELFDEATISPPPVLASLPVVNAASFDTRIGQGGLISVFGWQLGVETLDNNGRPLALGRRSGVSLTIGEQELPLLMVSPTQVNATLPEGLTGPVTLRVATPGGEAFAPIDIAPVAPALFASAVDSSGLANTAETPCAVGSTLTVFGTGLSRVEGTVFLRIAAERIPARMVNTGVPGLTGLEFTVPSSLTFSSYPLWAEVGSYMSNWILIYLRR
jgi:uncharacterized protein (TIGR03437 family)